MFVLRRIHSLHCFKCFRQQRKCSTFAPEVDKNDPESCKPNVSHSDLAHHRRPKSPRRRYVSMLFQNFGQIQPKELSSTCRSHQLMQYNDVLAPCHPGGFHLLPFGQRALEKLICIIDSEMDAVGGQKISMPTLAPAEFWKKSGRWESTGAELFTLKDRHEQEYCLGPTHEELLTSLFASICPVSYQRLPQMLYQTTRKFRDEMSPKYGLLRGREFEMKDMYTFDTDEQSAMQTYEAVCEAYCRIFDRIGVPYVKAQGTTGNIGGSLSHEFHYPARIGEDTLMLCDRCGLQINKEMAGDASKEQICTQKGTKCDLMEKTAIEVGHCFYLGTKYSSVFNATYTDHAGEIKTTHMGCFGLGVTRVLQATVEVLSTERKLRWPSVLAPYQVCIIPQMEGFQEELYFHLAEEVSDRLTDMPHLAGEVVIDDRTQFTIGRRLYEASRLGYPYTLVLGKKALQKPSLIEVHESSTGETTFLSREQIQDLMQTVKTV